MQTTGGYSTMVKLPVTVIRNFTIKKANSPILFFSRLMTWRVYSWII